MISITADATHYVNCGGYIRMIDCTFENQKDDATNIHGLYMAVERSGAPTNCCSAGATRGSTAWISSCRGCPSNWSTTTTWRPMPAGR